MHTTTIESFPAHLVNAARAAVAKAQAKLVRAATRAGQTAPAAPVLTVVPGSERVASRTTEGGAVVKFRAADLEVTYARPALDGWEFLAVVEPLADGNLLRAVPGATVAEGELDRWRTGALACDHCNAIRRRAETFVVRHDGGTHKQVGRQCLAAFLGGKSAAAIIAALAWPDIIRGAGESEGGMGSNSPLYSTTEFLARG